MMLAMYVKYFANMIPIYFGVNRVKCETLFISLFFFSTLRSQSIEVNS